MSQKQTILRFKLNATGNSMDIMSRFHPEGKTVLNRTKWRGKEPRSCGVTRVNGHAGGAVPHGTMVVDLEVSYRPKGCITFVGDTKYDGWTAMMVDRMKDGTLLDGHGKHLPEGQPPVYLPFELYEDIEFNDLDFGEFIGESVLEGVRHQTYDEVMKEIHEQTEKTGRFNASGSSTFMAPRRQRPSVKIVLSNAPSGVGRDGFGTRIINVNNFTPQVQQVVLDHLTELVNGFIEGRYSIKNISTDDFVFAELDDVLVDCTPNEQGEGSRFNILHEYVPKTFLEDLAIKLMANYEVEVGVVNGPKGGLVLKRVTKGD